MNILKSGIALLLFALLNDTSFLPICCNALGVQAVNTAE